MRKRKNLKRRKTRRKTRRNTRRKIRKKTRKKKGGENIFNELGSINNNIDVFKEKIGKITDFKNNVSLARNTLKSLKDVGIGKGRNVVSKIKSAKQKLTPCTIGAIVDRIACSEKFQHTSSPPHWRPPEWFQKKPEHSKFLKKMCKNQKNIYNTLQPGNFDYFKPKASANEGCQARTEEKLLNTNMKMNRDDALKSDKFYLNLSPEEKREMNEQERKFKLKEGINLVSLEQTNHVLAGQKHKPGERKGRGKNKHLSKKTKKIKREKKKVEKKEREFYNRMIQPVPNAEFSQKNITGGKGKSKTKKKRNRKTNRRR